MPVTTRESKKPPLLSQARAAKAYAGFTGHLPNKVDFVQLDDDPVAGYGLGPVEGIAYEATRDGKTEKYFHRFSRKSRPYLVSKDDGSQLYVVRGAYKVGDRGIEDMPPLMIVNPSKRPSLRRGKKGQFMARTSHRRRRRASNITVWNRNPAPVRRVRRRARRRSTFRANPIFATPHRRRRRAATAKRVSVRRYRRNPTGLAGGRGSLRFMALVGPAAGIAMGAVGVELAMGYLPLPASLTTGPVRYLTKGALAVVVGMGISKFANRKAGEAFALGGLVIAFHDALKSGIINFMPTAKFGAYVPRGGMGYYSPGQQVPAGRMNAMGLIPPPAGSPGAPTSFGVYARPGFAGAGRASDGGNQYPV
jgi:hypothetical protein